MDSYSPASFEYTVDYVYLNGRPVAEFDVYDGSSSPLYFETDRIGAPQLGTDSEQKSWWDASYEPFGQLSWGGGKITQSLRLPGHVIDDDTNWIHNGFRDYAPTLGRYLEPDPLGRRGSGNDLYVYVGDNPTNLTDPLGLCPLNKVSKHYGRTIPCTSSAADVMNFVESSFGTFGDYSRWWGEESVTFEPPSGMGVGSTIPISIGIFGLFQNLSVNIASMSSQSMTFTTNPGHLLYPASITFSDSQAGPNQINFNIDVGGTIPGLFQLIEFYGGGGQFEDAQWNHFLDQVSAFCQQE